MPTPQISTFEELQTFITTNFPDNNSGLIDPEDIRVALRSFVDIQTLRNDMMTANLSPEQAAAWQELIGKLEQIQRDSLSGIKGIATQTNAPTPGAPFETWKVTAPITSPNSWGNLVVTQANLDLNFVYFNVAEGVVSKETSAKPTADASKPILLSTAIYPINAGSQLIDDSVADKLQNFLVKITLTSGQTPTTNPEKVSKIGGDLEVLSYYNNIPDKPQKNVTVVGVSGVLSKTNTLIPNESLKIQRNIPTEGFNYLQLDFGVPYSSNSLTCALLGVRVDNSIEVILPSVQKQGEKFTAESIDISNFKTISISYDGAIPVIFILKNKDEKLDAVKKEITKINEDIERLSDYFVEEKEILNVIPFEVSGLYWNGSNVISYPDTVRMKMTKFINLKKGEGIECKLQITNGYNYGIIVNDGSGFRKVSNSIFIAEKDCLVAVSTETKIGTLMFIEGVDYYAYKIRVNRKGLSILNTPVSSKVDRNLLLTEATVIGTHSNYQPITSGTFPQFGNSIAVVKDGVSKGVFMPEVSKYELLNYEVLFKYNRTAWEKHLISKKTHLNRAEVLDIDGAGWCWFGSPLMVSDGTKTFLSYVNNKVWVAEINHSDNSVIRKEISSWIENDDHNQASLLLLDDGRILSSYSKHTASNNFQVRKSTNPLDITTWNAEITVATTDKSGYAHLFKLANGNIIHIYRNGPRTPSMTWRYYISTDNGDSWVLGGDICQSNGGYIRPYQDDIDKNIIHFITTDRHPFGLLTNIYYFKFNFNTQKYFNASGVEIVSSMPLTIPLSEKLTDYPANTSGWVEDLIVHNGKPRLVFAKYVNFSNDNARDKRTCYMFHNGDTWSGEIELTKSVYGWVSTIPGSEYEPNYSTAAKFDENDPNVVWTSIQDKGVWEMYRIGVSDGISYEKITHNSKSDQWRPNTAKNSPYVVWLDKNVYVSYISFVQGVMMFDNRK